MAEERTEPKRLVRRMETNKLVKQKSDEFFMDLKHARENGKKVGWTFGPIPFDLLKAMDIPFQHLESYGARVAARKAHGELKDMAHAVGFPRDVCSYCRITQGRKVLDDRGMLDRMSPEIVFPTPDFVWSTNTCATMVLTCDSVARSYHVPLFLFEYPNWAHESEIPEIKLYMRRQLEDFIKFLEDLCHRPFAYDKLSEDLYYTKKASELRMKCLDLCKTVPSPMTVFDHFISMGEIHARRGTQASVDFFTKLLAETQDRVNKKIGAVTGEKYRLYWHNLAVWFKVGHLSEKLASLNSNIVISDYAWHPWYRHDLINPADPIGSILDVYTMVWGSRTLDHQIEVVTNLVRDYSVDGMLLHSARTCRPHDLGQYDLIEIIERRLGVPGLMIDGDPTDPDFYSDAQVDTRLEAFIETLAARKKRGK